jgi:hypothetical protein
LPLFIHVLDFCYLEVPHDFREYCLKEVMWQFPRWGNADENMTIGVVQGDQIDALERPLVFTRPKVDYGLFRVAVGLFQHAVISTGNATSQNQMLFHLIEQVS